MFSNIRCVCTVKFYNRSGGMVKNNSISIGCQKVILAVAVFFCGLLEPAYCETNGPVLLLQQTPLRGGTITPGAGVHHFEPNTSVTLMAVPQPGYQFVYWLGDVGDPTSNRTTVYLDAPKIVVAVFERTAYALEQTGYAIEEVVEMTQSIPGGLRGGLMVGAADYAQQGAVSAADGRRSSVRSVVKPTKPEPSLDIPVPIPEPATVVLLAVGSFLALARRQPKKLTCTKVGDKTLK